MLAKKLSILVLVLVAAFAVATQVIRLDLQAYKVAVVQENGSPVEKFQAALGTQPGDVLEYRLNAQNTADRSLRQVALAIPIPRETAYQPTSAKALKLGETLVQPEFSFDGGRTYGQLPLKKKVQVTENGKVVEKEIEVKPEEFSNVRWVIPQFSTKEQLVLTMRVVVR